MTGSLRKAGLRLVGILAVVVVTMAMATTVMAFNPQPDPPDSMPVEAVAQRDYLYPVGEAAIGSAARDNPMRIGR